MAANLAELGALFGIGGLLGLLAGAMTVGQRFANHLSQLAATIDAVLKDPRRADLGVLVQEIKIVESDARTLMGLIKQIIKK